MAHTTIVDVSFPIDGEPLAMEHRVELLEALARVLGRSLGEAWTVHPIRGRRATNCRLIPDHRSFLRIRMPSPEVPPLERLAGSSLIVGDATLVLGSCSVLPLAPSKELRAAFVCIPGALDGNQATAIAAVRAELDTMDLAQPLESIAVRLGPRRLMKVGDKTVVGLAVELRTLLADPSLEIQARGMGRRRHYGAGLFLPP